MNLTEESLRRSLQRKDPDPGFTERVLSRVRSQSEPPRKHFSFILAHPSRWLAAASIVGLIASSGLFHWQRERRLKAEGEVAKAQLMQALQITSAKLNIVLKKINSNKETS